MEDICDLLNEDVLTGLRKIEAKKFDLIISSPPYNIRKSYEREKKVSLGEYFEWQSEIISKLVGLLNRTGSICWQTGNFVSEGEIFPLDIYFYDLFKKLGLKLRGRIIWKYNFGRHSTTKFSGRYETILWFSKSDEYKFNLDPVRVPQMYPGKRHPSRKLGKAGLPSGNPLGKNPSDYWEFSPQVAMIDNPVWDIPNVKSNHPEKTFHPCQYPIELAERCVLALTNEQDFVLDPFVGTGSSAIAAIKHNRFAVGIDKDGNYINIARLRLESLIKGELKMRELGTPVYKPSASRKVAKIPEEWLSGF